MTNTIPRLLPASQAASLRAARGKAAPDGQAESNGGVVSGKGENQTSPRPATGDPSAATPATTVSLSRSAAAGIAAYESQEKENVTRRWSESAAKAIAEKIEEAAEAADRTGLRVKTEVHKETGRYIMRVVDESGEILKEFPPAEYLDVVAALEELGGLLLQEEL